MEYKTHKHDLPDSCSKDAFMDTMVQNVLSRIDDHRGSGFNLEDAISVVRQNSCAGSKVWEIVLSNLRGAAAETETET